MNKFYSILSIILYVLTAALIKTCCGVHLAQLWIIWPIFGLMIPTTSESKTLIFFLFFPISIWIFIINFLRNIFIK